MSRPARTASPPCSALPAARGLFRKAIAQSGAASWVATRDRAAEIARLTLDKLAVRPHDIEALQAVPVEQLLDAQPHAAVTVRGSGAALAWQPVIDGDVLSRTPLDAVTAGEAAGVHLLIGTNEHEVTLFQVLDPTLAELDDDGIVTLLASVTDRRRAAPAGVPRPHAGRDCA